MPLVPAGSSKAAWRAWAQQAWQAEVELHSAAVIDHLLAWTELQQAEVVLAYSAMSGELDLGGLIHSLGGRVVLPRLTQRGTLSLHLAGSQLERHRLGFWQPAAGSRAVDPAKIDVGLIPGLCFDRRGVRLGRGTAHFDRLLTRVRPQVPKVGVAVARVVVDELPEEAHDVRMTHLVTETGLWSV